MANIRPFRALRYDLPRAGDPADLLAPPYDVVDDAGRAKIAARSTNNCIRVILPEGDGDTRYARGAAEFRRLVDEALVRDDAPGLYVYHQRFESEGKTYTRKGFVCLIELTAFGEGPVLAHERTLSGPKRDRLELMRACEAHLELVFGLFSDPEHGWEQAVAPHLAEPVLDCELDGIQHTLYRVADAAATARVVELLADKNIYIADGHHRYSTMVEYGRELADRGRAGARFGMIYLSNLDDDGLVVLPTHRLVHGLASFDLAATLGAVAPFFDHREVPMPAAPLDLRGTLMEAGKERAAFGLTVPGSGALHLLTLRADFDPAAAGLGALPAALQRLDVALLHELVLERALGITKEAQAAKTNLRYYKSTEAALDVAQGKDAGDNQLVCFMNATPVSDVVAVCDSGEVMPQKSTFFYPKIPTGLCFHDLKDPT